VNRTKIGSEWDDVRSLLFQLRKVSEAHFKRCGGWSIHDQICHTHSEVSELYELIRKRHLPTREEMLEEIWDVVFSAITNAHVLGFSDEELLQGMISTLRKIQSRVNR